MKNRQVAMWIAETESNLEYLREFRPLVPEFLLSQHEKVITAAEAYLSDLHRLYDLLRPVQNVTED